VCDTSDNCPQDANADQADGDGDGLGDACDPCTNGTAVSDAKLRLSHVTPPPGDDRLKLQGQITLAYPFSPPLDPATKGVRILVADSTGQNVVDALIPGGAYNYATQTGWKVNASHTAWQYKNGLGGIQGIIKVIVKSVASTPSVIRLAAVGRNGSYAAPPNGLPLSATFVIDSPAARTGQCGEAAFPGAPGPACTFNGLGSAVTCK